MIDHLVTLSPCHPVCHYAANAKFSGMFSRRVNQ